MKRRCVAGLFVTAIAVFMFLAGNACAATALQPSQPKFPNASLLVSADSLEQCIANNEQNLVIIDARTSGYDSLHIPGAINLKYGDYYTGGTGLFPVATLNAKLSAAGLTRTMRFVIYDDTTASFGAAGRIFWMLEYLGCKKVHILDGGWDKWTADGKATVAAPTPPLPANTFVAAVNSSAKIKKARLLARLHASDFVVLDTRSDPEYLGWQLYGEARGGHIPGSVQISYPRFFNADKTVLRYGALRTMFESRGITKDKEVAAHCTVGIRSGFGYFLLRLMGYPLAKNYDGSIAEWSADSACPMQKAPRFSEIVHPSWVKALIDYSSGASLTPPPEYPYDASHKYLIFETQWGTLADATAYTSGHIPGAIHSNSDTYENGYPRWFLLPDSELHAALGTMGITADTTVVVYSDSPIFAARLWWILKYAGVTDVRFLNGGYAQWIAEGYAGETATNLPTPTTFTGTVHPEYLATTSQVAKYVRKGSLMFLTDVRSRKEYVGKISGYDYLEAKGRIPGAIWAHDGSGDEYIDADDGTLRSYTEIKSLWRSFGITSSQASLFDRKVIFYCGSGYRSALAFLYAHLMGYDNILNYSNGWEDWSTIYTEDASCTGITPGWCQEPSNRPIEVGAP